MGKFYIYDNWLRSTALVHAGACRNCKFGQGKHSLNDDARRIDRWLGPFPSRGKAMTAAGLLRRRNTRHAKCCMVAESAAAQLADEARREAQSDGG
ncbi:MAG: hypothetical protein OXG46_05680 [Chloroflexi bacterium]|nr:hypothetical protein [Chloroflexota bacterium]